MVLDLIVGALMYAQSVNPSLHQAKPYDRAHYAAAKPGCPKAGEVKKLIPKYGVENLVAEFSATGKFRDELSEHLDNEFAAAKDFRCRAYNSKSITNPNSILSSDVEFNLMLHFEKDILQLLQSQNFDIIEFYERNDLNQLHNKPSAIIYRTKKITYIMFDLKGRKGLADGKFDEVKCCYYWSPDLVTETADEIVKKKLKQPGVMPIQPFNP